MSDWLKLNCPLSPTGLFVLTLQRVKLRTVLDTDKCHTCKIGREHYPRDADTFDLIINEKRNTLKATVDITVHAASDSKTSQEHLKDGPTKSTLVKLSTVQVTESNVL